MTIETNGHRINIDIAPLLILIFLGDKVDKNLIRDIATPDFSIVVRPSKKSVFTAREGDNSIIIRKENGREIPLGMPHRGSKCCMCSRCCVRKHRGDYTSQEHETLVNAINRRIKEAELEISQYKFVEILKFFPDNSITFWEVEGQVQKIKRHNPAHMATN